MAEKGFGVKEVNLIGASGTPTITSPNNLNLNAVNVAISTNATVGGTLSVTGNVSVGGTLTYEDVTNVDAIGIITAREGISLPDSKNARFGTDNDARIYHNGLHLFIKEEDSGQIFIDGANGVSIQRGGVARIATQSDGAFVTGNLGVSNNIAAANINIGSNIQLGNAGVVTATTFSGSGASLTSLPAANLTGTLPAISGANLTNLPADTPTNSDIQVAYTVTANGSSAYRFAGNGVVSTADNPDIFLTRGQKYRFINNSGGSHPFQIQYGGSAYSTGVTNNNASSGNIDFAPTYDSPAILGYQCTSHSDMGGTIYLRGGSGNETNVGVTTFSQTISGVAGVNVTSQGLDHYEEGTFTPFIGALSSMPSVTYGSERGGKYTRIGNMVFYSLGMNIASYSGGSGNSYIGGFPYVGAGTPGWDGAHVFRDCSAIGLNSRLNQLRGWMETSTAAGYPYMHLQQHSNTATFAAGTIAASSITTGRITVHGHYQVG